MKKALATLAIFLVLLFVKWGWFELCAWSANGGIDVGTCGEIGGARVVIRSATEVLESTSFVQVSIGSARVRVSLYCGQ